MKNFRIYYRQPGVTTKRTPCEIIKAATAEKAVEVFNVRHRGAGIIAIFAD